MDRLERLKDQFVAMVSPSIVAALGNHDQGIIITTIMISGIFFCIKKTILIE